MPGLERAVAEAACAGVMGHRSQGGRGAKREARQYFKQNFTHYSILALISTKWKMLHKPFFFNTEEKKKKTLKDFIIKAI